MSRSLNCQRASILTVNEKEACHGVEEQNRDTPEQAAQSERPGEGAATEVEEPFSYEGYQVVRGEFFAHIREPSIVFNNSKVAVNSACINKLPEVDYVQILINPDSKKLAVRPCTEDEKDSFLWYSLQKGKRKPKQITWSARLKGEDTTLSRLQ